MCQPGRTPQTPTVRNPPLRRKRRAGREPSGMAGGAAWCGRHELARRRCLPAARRQAGRAAGVAGEPHLDDVIRGRGRERPITEHRRGEPCQRMVAIAERFHSHCAEARAATATTRRPAPLQPLRGGPRRYSHCAEARAARGDGLCLRNIWKASDLQRLRADHGLVISAGKMSGLWSGHPASVRDTGAVRSWGCRSLRSSTASGSRKRPPPSGRSGRFTQRQTSPRVTNPSAVDVMQGVICGTTCPTHGRHPVSGPPRGRQGFQLPART